ncbi:MAG TPA: HD-GYP domain-containing protein [Chloroflexota bacterium]|nr:HD-GYP domain-containing protein [Chloroflexota bacterium]
MVKRQDRLNVYIALIGLAGAAVLGTAGVLISRMPASELAHWWPYALLFAFAGWLCCRQHVYFTESTVVAMGSIAQIASIIVLPLPIALWVIGVAKASSELSLRISQKRRDWRSIPLNTGSSVLANLGGGASFHLLNGDHFLWSTHLLYPLAAFPALLALAALYHVIDALVVTGAVTLSSGERPASVFWQISTEARLPELSLIAVGVVFAVLFHFSPVLSLLVVVPVILSMQSFAAVARLRKETIEAVLKMAESIDYRDTGTYEHSERLAEYTRRLGTGIGLTPEHIKEVVLASRVHDLGKIGISNDILLKPGPLTLEERQIMEEHPVIGANILSSYSSFRDAVDIVRHHHERWDGKGYPDGLKGEAIPIGSRIITVVDSYDAMTSDRPYRRGLSASEAVERLKAGMGSQFDPQVAACFIQLLIDDGIFVPSEPPMNIHIVKAEAG